MAVKINLDPADDLTYRRKVAIPTVDGRALKIEFTFRHRTREALAELFDAYIEKAKAAADAERDDAESSLADRTKRAIERDVETAMDIATDWDVDRYPFNKESLTKFFRLYPGAAEAIAADYRVSHTEGRLGN